MATISSGGSAGKVSGSAAAGERYLMDVTNGQRTPLPFDDKAAGIWVDGNTYLYTQSQGGLSGVGTWAYDRAANSNKRLIGVAVDVGRVLYLPKRNEMWAASQQSGVNLIRLKLDGSPSQNLGSCALFGPQRMPPAETAVDLGFGGAKVDLWEPVKVDEAALAATQPAEPPEGKLKLFELTKDCSAEEKKFTEFAYDYGSTNMYLNNYCDPVKFAMKLLPVHREQPQTPLSNLLLGMNFSDIVERDHLVRYGHDQAMAQIAMDTQLTPDQKRQVGDKTGTLLADAWAKDAKGDLQNINLMFQKALSDAKRSVAPGGPVVGPGTPQTAGAQQQPQQTNSQQDQNQQQQQQQTQKQPKQQQPAGQDKAANEAQKAKDAANRLRGIFRR
jgi:hypothetical protein